MERQGAHFYRITITEADLKAGVIITCKSTGKDKFKIVFFDQEVGGGIREEIFNQFWLQGHVTMVEESQQSKRSSEANLYVVPYGEPHCLAGLGISCYLIHSREIQFNGINAIGNDETPGR